VEALNIHRVYALCRGPERRCEELQHLHSRALGAQIPNPGSIRSRVKREILDVSPRAGAVWCHSATVPWICDLTPELGAQV
jgi:hypothetical protein